MPTSADAVVHFLAPVVLVVAVFMGFAVLPMGRNMVLVNMDAGLLFLLRDGRVDGAVGVHGGMVEPQQVFAAGRDARGGADDQLRSGAAAVERCRSDDDGFALAGDRLSRRRTSITRGLPHWFIFTPWGLAGFVMFAIAATAETNRSPFDLAGGRVGAGGGIFTRSIRDSSLRCFSWANMWRCFRSRDWDRRCFWVDGPRRSRSWHGFLRGSGSSGRCWSRSACSSGCGERCRGFRQDQLMNFAWKFVLPMCLLNLFVAGLWRFMGEGWLRWVVCSAILVLAYVVMGNAGCEGSIRAEELPLCGVRVRRLGLRIPTHAQRTRMNGAPRCR